MSVSDDILRMANGWGQRGSTFRFDLLDESLEQIGELTVDASRPPSIDNDVDSSLKRKLSNVRIPVSEGNDINTFTDRLRVVMVIPGAGEYPLGVFLPASPVHQPYTRQDWTSIDGLDQLTMLDQDIEQTWAVAPGQNFSQAITTRFEMAGVPVYEIEYSTTKLRGNEWLIWPAGENGLDLVNDLCDNGAYYSPYFDNTGTGRVRKVPDLAGIDPEHIFGVGKGVIEESVEIVRDTWKLPNRFIVTSNGDNNEVISGYWDVPASAPHSKESRGRIISHTYDMQGIETNEDATEAAKAKGQTHDRVYETVEFDTPIFPLLDTFDVVGFEENKHHHGGWSFTCQEGAVMRHNLRRIFVDESLST